MAVAMYMNAVTYPHSRRMAEEILGMNKEEPVTARAFTYHDLWEATSGSEWSRCWEKEGSAPCTMVGSRSGRWP